MFFLLKGSPENFRAVWKAIWIIIKAIDELKEKRKIVKKSEIDKSQDLILNKSIVFEFYIKGNKTYNSLKS